MDKRLSHDQPFFTAQLLTFSPGINRSYQPVPLEQAFARLSASKELKQFKRAVKKELPVLSQVDWKIVRAIQTLKAKRKQVPLVLTIVFYYPTLWKRDLDGGEKAVQDAIFDYLGLNDNLVVDKPTRKRANREHPHIDISLRLAPVDDEEVWEGRHNKICPICPSLR